MSAVRVKRKMRNQLICEAYQSDERIASIAKRLGVAQSTIRQVAKQHGIPPRRDFSALAFLRRPEFCCARCHVILDRSDSGWGLTNGAEAVQMCGDCLLEVQQRAVWKKPPDRHWLTSVYAREDYANALQQMQVQCAGVR